MISYQTWIGNVGNISLSPVRHLQYLGTETGVIQAVSERYVREMESS
jgi:hypothetical protein